MTSKTYAFLNGFVYAMSIKMQFYTTDTGIAVDVFTNSKIILDSITALKRLWKQSLVNHISEICRDCKENKIYNVAWIYSEQKVADDLTFLV